MAYCDAACQFQQCGGDPLCMQQLQQQLQQDPFQTQACQPWDQDCLQRQQGLAPFNGAPPPPMHPGGQSWNLFGIGIALLFIVGVPFLVVGISLRGSFNKWPSKQSDRQG
jgi:hypothetical protein